MTDDGWVTKGQLITVCGDHSISTRWCGAVSHLLSVFQQQNSECCISAEMINSDFIQTLKHCDAEKTTSGCILSSFSVCA